VRVKWCISNISAFCASLGLFAFAACTTEPLTMGPNGDARIREIAFENRILDPPFDPLHTNYSVYLDGEETLRGVVVPFAFHTKVFLNGKTVRLNTNMYALPDFTDLTEYFDEDDKLRIETQAQDGNSREYTVTRKGALSDARITSVNIPLGGSERIKGVYTEYPSPHFRPEPIETTNGEPIYAMYEFSANDEDATLIFEKGHAGAKVSLSIDGGLSYGSEFGSGGEVAHVDFIGLTTLGQTYRVRCVSQDEKVTNIKDFKGTLINGANDARIINLVAKANGEDIPFLPRFNYSGHSNDDLAYNASTAAQNGYKIDPGGRIVVILDNTDRVRLEGTFQKDGTAIAGTVRHYGATATNPDNLPTAYTDDAFHNDDFPQHGSTFCIDLTVKQGDRLQLYTTQGSGHATYWIEFRLFTREYYGFDGGLRRLNDDVYMFKDIPDVGYSVEGIITFVTKYPETVQDGWFLEDGAYGLYCWSWNVWRNKPVQFRVGQRVVTGIGSAKIWQGMPEVTGSTGSEIQASSRRFPLHYLNANQTEFAGTKNLGRMLRWDTAESVDGKLVRGYNENGMGDLSFSKQFKVFFNNNTGLIDNVDKTEAATYMKTGMRGKFFGPLFLDGEGYSLLMKDKHYMIVPDP